MKNIVCLFFRTHPETVVLEMEQAKRKVYKLYVQTKEKIYKESKAYYHQHYILLFNIFPINFTFLLLRLAKALVSKNSIVGSHNRTKEFLDENDFIPFLLSYYYKKHCKNYNIKCYIRLHVCFVFLTIKLLFFSRERPCYAFIHMYFKSISICMNKLVVGWDGGSEYSGENRESIYFSHYFSQETVLNTSICVRCNLQCFLVSCLNATLLVNVAFRAHQLSRNYNIL